MRIWLITVGEPLPIDGDNERLLRTGILAAMLARRGHEVVWWSSAFDHVRKRHRVTNDGVVTLSGNYRIILMHSCGYRRNISLARLLDHHGLARKFAKMAIREPAPDVILCSMPTIELGCEAVRYAKAAGVPVVLDVRDLWPDIFLDLVPSWARGGVRLMLSPLFRKLNEACTGATAITGITAPIMEWGLDHAGRPRTGLDRDFPLGYVERAPSSSEIETARAFWESFGIRSANDPFTPCFFGTFGRQFDLETVIHAARLLEGGPRPFRFIMCGSGDRFAYYRKLAGGLANMVFPGWVGAAEIWTLMRMSDVGLTPYFNSIDFRASLPNKSIEYLSAGLPVVSSLKGELEKLLAVHACGVNYLEGNPEDLAATLVGLYDNRVRLKAMAENALRLYQGTFRAEKVYKELGDYLEELVRVSPQGREGAI